MTWSDNTFSVCNDEPTLKDTLNRDQYAKAFANLAESCDTPLVIGLYGTWGVGKTSLMKLIQNELDGNKVQTVWFDAWQHQSDDNPSLSLLQTVVDTFKMGGEVKKLLMVIATAFGSAILKTTVHIKAKDLIKLGQMYEEGRFLVREKQVQLRQRFEELIKKAIEKKFPTGGWLVFFIDDIDRCSPERVLNLLEALKLYLNLPDCVYFIGVDREMLEKYSSPVQGHQIQPNQLLGQDCAASF